MVTVYFMIFIVILLLIGISSAYFSKQTSEDYLLASRSIPAWQTALSALATTYSGFMYIGLIGYTWIEGVSGIWLITAWVFGELIMIVYVPKKVFEVADKEKALSYNGLLSSYNHKKYRSVQIVVALVTLIFLSIYAAAQLSAGGKTLHVLLDWEYTTGVIIGYVVVVIYCFSGGIRASIWTDTVQFIVMIISMILLVNMGLESVGGVAVFWQKLAAISPEYRHFFPSSMGGLLAIILFFMGWIFAGLGMAGQPHIMVRYMAMKKKSDGRTMLYYYYPSAIIFTSLALASALIARVYFAQQTGIQITDPETVLPEFAMAILPPALVGLILAGIFSAIVSTADSQLLSCASAMGNDLLKQPKNAKKAFWQNKIAMLSIATFVLGITLYGSSSVFYLVVVAWSVLAGSFAPLLVFRFMGFGIAERQALATIISGLSATILWEVYGDSTIYEGMIGICVGALVFLTMHYLPKQRA